MKDPTASIVGSFARRVCSIVSICCIVYASAVDDDLAEALLQVSFSAGFFIAITPPKLTIND
jgi:hypothetical protein